MEREEAEEEKRMERATVYHGKQREEGNDGEAVDEQMPGGVLNTHRSQKQSLQPQHPAPQQQQPIHVPTPPSMLGKPGD
eukprot:8694431-Alexandrium_andersonii.AAC.1